MNVLEPGAFNAESQYFITPSLIKFHDFADNKQPRGDEASNRGCNSGPRGHDFPDNSNIYF
jgi:hypothetical protein